MKQRYEFACEADYRLHKFDAGEVGISICGAGKMEGIMFFVDGHDARQVIATLKSLLKPRHWMHAEGAEKYMPRGRATLGGYETGFQVACEHSPLLSRRISMTIYCEGSNAA